MAGYIGSKAVSVNTTSATISDDLAVGDDLAVTGLATIGETLAVTGVVTANAGVVVDNFTLDGTTLALSSGDMTIDVAGNIQLDADDSGEVRLLDGGTSYLFLKKDGNSAVIQSQVSDGDIFFGGNDGGSLITALTLDMSDAGAAIFNGTLMMPDRIKHTGDTDTYFQFSAANTISLVAGDVETFKTTGSEVTFNESGADVDIRFESANSANTLFIEGQSGNGTPSIGINNNDPTKLGNSGTAALGAGAGPVIHISGDDSQIRFDNQVLHADNSGATIFHVRNNYGLTSASAELSLEGGFISFNTGTSLAEVARLAGGHLYISTSAEPSASQTGTRVSGVNGQNFWKSANGGSGGYNQFAFFNANGLVGNITTSGSGTSFGTSSDYRLKENVVYDWDATTRLKQLKPARFNFIADADTTVDGFLAHEAQAVVPECATGTKDAMKDEEYEVTPEVLTESGSVETPAVMGTRSVPDIQSIDQSKLVPLLVKAIQELEARITALEG